jgi:predicted DsbA family dithiol-disulfide isomerase
LKQVAAEVNLPWGERTETFNSRRATELGKWAEAMDRGDSFHMAVFKAYFVHGLNIARIPVLQEICGGLDLDPQEAAQVLAERRYKKSVDDDWAYSRRIGVTAVPAFLAAGRIMVGAQPYNVLEKLVQAGPDAGLKPFRI